jgi:ubiquinol-cytochrome c reductase cytochrome b subunit
LAGAPGTGSFLSPDPLPEHELLTEMLHEHERRALTAVREHQESINGSLPDGQQPNGEKPSGQH